MERRKILRGMSSTVILVTAGCTLSDDESLQIPLQRLRVVNLYSDKLDVNIHITNGEKNLYFSNTVNPISEGSSEEWVVKPAHVDDSLVYNYSLEIKNGATSTITSQTLDDIYKESNNACLELSWLIRDPTNDIGVFPQSIHECAD